MNYENIILEKKENIAKITLNRPERLNALSAAMTQELFSAIADVDEDNEMRVVVITGAGRGFCAGVDVGRVSEGVRERRSESPEEARQGLTRGATRLISGLQKLEKPIIAMVNGVAVGAGFDIVLACDLRVGSENVKFANAYLWRGIFPGYGGTWLYPRVMGLGKALEYLLTGDYIEAKEAEKIGVLNYLVPAEELEEKAMTLARKIASRSPVAIRLTKLQVYKGLEMELETALRFAAACEAIARTSEDAKEAVKAQGEKRDPIFHGR